MLFLWKSVSLVVLEHRVLTYLVGTLAPASTVR